MLLDCVGEEASRHPQFRGQPYCSVAAASPRVLRVGVEREHPRAAREQALGEALVLTGHRNDEVVEQCFAQERVG